MRKFLIGAAAMALAAGSAMADPGGKGGGGGKGNDKGQAAQSHAHHGGAQGAKPNGGPAMREAKADKGQGRADREPEVRTERQVARGNQGNGAKAEKRNERAVERQVQRSVERGNARQAERPVERRVVRDVRDDRRGDDARLVRTVAFGDDRRSFLDGCPPGLAKKNNGCMPPGLAKQREHDWRDSYYQPTWWGYRAERDGRYFYDDGYLYRLGSNNSVLGYVPLLGGALSVGNPWPSYYEPYQVPQYYQDYYNLGPADSYRYADDVLYRVDPQSGVIDSIAALLTGDQFAVGQPMPAGYDVYNVPYGYQERYYDTDNAYYRYADGYVYEVDPQTQLIQTIIELIV